MLTPCLMYAADPAVQTSPWVPDQGDGTYRNPVLWADYSDPDAIRVGDDYYLISSSFTEVPGLPVLHSRDLVNWTLLAHALPRLVPEDHFSTVHPGDGVWAPAIRYHNGQYHIFYPDPDFGIYLLTATNAAGPWSKPRLVKPGKGLIDPCPFWDDDGSAYLIHAWAGSRAHINNLLTLCRLSPDGTQVLDDGKLVVDGHKIPGCLTLEGPKLYKRNGWYYIFAPAGGIGGGYQCVFRSKTIGGPYEQRITLAQGSTRVNGPHQGAWVNTPSGQDWFLHFQDRGAYGRVVHLEPMAWHDDWPVMGSDPGNSGKGEPVANHAKPATRTPQSIEVPQTTDEFKGPELGLAWQWRANPRPEWASLTIRPDWLRLACMSASSNLYLAPNLLVQKFPGPGFTATTELEFLPGSDGDETGLCVIGSNYAWIGLRQTASAGKPPDVHLCLVTRDKAGEKDGGSETEAARLDLPVAAAGMPIHLFLCLTVRNTDHDNPPGKEARCTFTYSLDGNDFKPLAPDFVFNAKQGKWIGAKIGLFAVSTGNGSSGHADYAWFRVTRAQ